MKRYEVVGGDLFMFDEGIIRRWNEEKEKWDLIADAKRGIFRLMKEITDLITKC